MGWWLSCADETRFSALMHAFLDLVGGQIALMKCRFLPHASMAHNSVIKKTEILGRISFFYFHISFFYFHILFFKFGENRFFLDGKAFFWLHILKFVAGLHPFCTAIWGGAVDGGGHNWVCIDAHVNPSPAPGLRHCRRKISQPPFKYIFQTQKNNTNGHQKKYLAFWEMRS